LAGVRLLERSQDERLARTDIDGTDLFALMAALGWAGDQPAFASRADLISDVIAKHDPDKALDQQSRL
jgi:hypothetical protein